MSKMSCYFLQNSNTIITIPKYVESTTGITYYDIKVRVGLVEWYVERRYKDFNQLNEKLIEEIAISKKLLPPKKIVGNKNPSFLEQRRQQLEKYLQELMIFFRVQLPKVLAEFLDFNTYDIIYLLQDLANLFQECGDLWLSNNKEYHFSALQVYAISERLNLPCPQENIEHRGKYDFSHVLDFCTQLDVLKITPVKETYDHYSNDYNSVDVPIGRSNIIPNNLKFNLNAFRNIRTLKLSALSPENIIDIDVLKPTLKKICVHNTTITAINQVLLCDNIHKEKLIVQLPKDEDIALKCNKPITSRSASASLSVTTTTQPAASTATATTITNGNVNLIQMIPGIKMTWTNINELNFSGNLIKQIDESIRSVPQIQTLSLDRNRLTNIKNLVDLPHLQHLSLSANLISDCTDWHMKLGNLVSLDLSQNKLKMLQGLQKLLSLVHLDVSCNLIEDIEEVDNVACLPLLEALRLTGNPLATTVDYRARVLARFHTRAKDIILDSEKGTQKELDTALVLSALHISRLRQQNQFQQH